MALSPAERMRRYRGTEKYKRTTQNYHLLRAYGIDLAEKARMFAEQEGLCGVCLRPLPSDLSKVALDHAHCSGKLRKLLHHRCNQVVGLFELDKEFGEKVIRYLEDNDE